MDLKEALKLIGVGVALYLVWQVKQQLDKAGSAADEALDTFAKWVAGKPLRALGTIIFKDGTTLDVNKIALKHDPASDQMRFVWQGKTYRLLPRLPNNYYPAVPL